MDRRLISAVIIICSSLMAGCVTKHPTNPQDPYETFNRSAFKFNQAVDKYALKPIARVYAIITPDFMQKGITHFFSNIADITSIANDVLQLNLRRTLTDTTRVALNTSLGIGGLFDIATKFGIKEQQQDFGLTLAKWGVKKSAYIVIPIIGPSTLRDATALPIDFYGMSVWPHIRAKSLRYGLLGLDLTNQRKQLLATDKLINDAVDPYIFVRDAYLQLRKQQITTTRYGYNPDHITETQNSDDDTFVAE